MEALTLVISGLIGGFLVLTGIPIWNIAYSKSEDARLGEYASLFLKMQRIETSLARMLSNMETLEYKVASTIDMVQKIDEEGASSSGIANGKRRDALISNLNSIEKSCASLIRSAESITEMHAGSAEILEASGEA